MSEALTPSSLTPVRNPGLIRRVANAIFRSDPDYGPQPADQQTTQSGVVGQAVQSIYKLFRMESDRLAIYHDVDEMDRAAEEPSVALDTIADNVCTSEDGEMESFAVASEDARVQQILQDTANRAGLYEKIKPWTRNTVKYGDGFVEPVINAALEIVDAKQLPPATMYVNADQRGNLNIAEPRYGTDGRCLNSVGECAYEQRDQNQAVTAAFWPYQIVHTTLNPSGFSPYGNSLLRVTRVIWRKLKAIEEAMIIARLTRAWPSNRWFIDTTGQSMPQKKDTLREFQEAVNYRQALEGRRETPPNVGSDYFIADNWVGRGDNLKESRTRVETYDPKMTGLANIADYDALHRKMMATLRVPPAYLSFEQDINAKATLGVSDIQYIRFIREVQRTMGHGLKQIFDMALVLNGIDPEVTDYEIRWPRLSADDEAAAAASEQLRSEADTFYASVGAIDTEWIQRNRFSMDDEEIAAIKERVAAQDKLDAQKQADAAEAQAQAQMKLMPKPEAASPNGHNLNPPAPPPASNRAIRQDTTLVAEAIAQRARNLLAPDLDHVKQQYASALTGQ